MSIASCTMWATHTLAVHAQTKRRSIANCTMWATHTLAVHAQKRDGVSIANCTMWATHTLAVHAQTKRRCEYSELYNVGYTHSSCTCTNKETV